MNNTIEFKVYGDRAMFTTPESHLGGEKTSYEIPTYEALLGITESIYWKPTIKWIIDDVRVINPISIKSVGVLPIKWKERGHDIANYSYLSNCCYQVRAHFEWNEKRPDLENDRNEKKHYDIAIRSLEKGGRYDVFLGTRECQAYVEPCSFGAGEGYYDTQGERVFNLMYHGIIYSEDNSKTVNYWAPIMKNGVIHFLKPEECDIKRYIEATIKIKKNTKKGKKK